MIKQYIVTNVNLERDVKVIKLIIVIKLITWELLINADGLNPSMCVNVAST
jgi:hypothetical protein